MGIAEERDRAMTAHVRAAAPTESFVVTDDGCRLWTARHEAANAAPDVAASDVAKPGPDSAAILCHGGPGFWDTLAPIAELLAERGPAVRWDQRGGGRSQHQGPYTLHRFIADLDAVRSVHQVDRPVLVGHSWGASLALQYFLAHPDRVRSLIYIAGVGLSWDWRPEHNAASARALAPAAAKLAALRALARPTAGQQRDARLDGGRPHRALPRSSRVRARLPHRRRARSATALGGGFPRSRAAERQAGDPHGGRAPAVARQPRRVRRGD